MTANSINMQVARVNRKSVDLVLNVPFTDTMIVELRPVVSAHELIGHDLVNTSLASSEDEYNKTRVLLIDDDELLETGEDYEVSLFDGDILLGKTTFKAIEPPVVKDAKVEGVGTRIIKASFNYPLRNLVKTEVLPSYERVVEGVGTYEVTETRLVNFYVKYHGNEIASNVRQLAVDDPIPYNGYIYTNISAQLVKDVAGDPVTSAEAIERNPFTVDISDDLRTVIIHLNSRSLPQGDNHLFSINYSRQQDVSAANKNTILTDFENDLREVPIFEKQFSLESADYPAEIVDIKVNSLVEIDVTFDKAVILNPEEVQWVLCNGAKKDLVPLSSDFQYSRVRVGHTLNTIRYYISPETPLIPGDAVRLSVTPMTDSSGLKTKSNEIIKDVVPVPPTLDIVKQLIDEEFESAAQRAEYDGKTAVYIRYSTSMDVPSAIDVENYILYAEEDPDKTPILIEEINEFTDSPLYHDEFILKVEELKSGYYILEAKGVKDLTDIEMVPAVKRFRVIDQTIPEVERILVTDENHEGPKAILIMFNDDMKAKEAEHSVETTDNIKLVGVTGTSEADKKYTLDEDSTSELIVNNEWARITLPDVLPENLDVSKDLVEILLGYTRLRDIKYITNASGNIFPLCNKNAIDANVSPIAADAADATLTIVGSDTVIFYTGDNDKMFNPPSVSEADFVFELAGEVIMPRSITISANFSQVIVKFRDNIFTSATTGLVMKIVTNPSTLDIFGKKIKSGETNTLVNDLSASLVSISRINVEYASPQSVTLALKYSDALITRDPRDFIVETTEGMIIPVSTAELKDENKVIELVATTYLSVDLDTVNLVVSTADNRTGGLRTKDSDGRVINSFSKVPVIDNKILDFEWSMPSAALNLNESSFVVKFGKDIDWEAVSGVTKDSVTGLFNPIVINATLTDDNTSAIFEENNLITIKLNDSTAGTAATIDLGSIIIEGSASMITNPDAAGTVEITATIIDSRTMTIEIADITTIVFAANGRDAIIHADFIPSAYEFISLNDSVYVREDSSPSVSLVKLNTEGGPV